MHSMAVWAGWLHWLRASEWKNSKQRLHAHQKLPTLLQWRGTIPRGACASVYAQQVLTST